MKITIESKEMWRIEFSTDEMRILKEVSNSVGIPLNVFGGLSTDSPYVKVKADKAMEIINNNIDLVSLYENHLERPIALLRNSPKATTKLRKKIVDAISEYIPKGFFIAK